MYTMCNTCDGRVRVYHIRVGVVGRIKATGATSNHHTDSIRLNRPPDLATDGTGVAHRIQHEPCMYGK